jgi:hypothetical protein
MSHALATRRSRTSFTKVLERLCTRLDALNVYTVIDRHALKLGLKLHADVRVISLSVVGSFARGARTCGDLDVLLELESLNGRFPYIKHLAVQAFGTLPDVRYYDGTRETNSSGVAFPEAVLIWQEGLNWHGAIAAIKENPEATRFARGDQVPLRSEQTEAEADERRALTALLEQGVLRWRLLPSEGMPVLGELNSMQRELARYANLRWGKKSKELLQHILAYLGGRYPQGSFECGRTSTMFAAGGVEVRMGRPSLSVTALDSFTCARLALIPYSSRRGPNAIWEIERGDAHPLERALADRGLYLLCDPAGHPPICSMSAADDWDSAEFIEAFTSERAALNWQRQMREDGDKDDEFCGGVPELFAGRKLLDLLSYADTLELIDEEQTVHTYCFTLTGARVFQDEAQEIATTEMLLAVLPKVSTEEYKNIARQS